MLEVVIASLCSGLLGALITIMWADKQAIRKDKLEILTTLLSYRGHDDIQAWGYISPAINKIDLIFADTPEVLIQTKEFIKVRTTDIANKTDKEKQILLKEMDESHTNLIIAMAKSLKYKNITYDVVSRPYSPQALTEYFTLQSETKKSENAAYQNITKQN